MAKGKETSSGDGLLAIFNGYITSEYRAITGADPDLTGITNDDGQTVLADEVTQQRAANERQQRTLVSYRYKITDLNLGERTDETATVTLVEIFQATTESTFGESATTTGQRTHTFNITDCETGGWLSAG